MITLMRASRLAYVHGTMVWRTGLKRRYLPFLFKFLQYSEVYMRRSEKGVGILYGFWLI